MKLCGIFTSYKELGEWSLTLNLFFLKRLQTCLPICLLEAVSSKGDKKDPCVWVWDSTHLDQACVERCPIHVCECGWKSSFGKEETPHSRPCRGPPPSVTALTLSCQGSLKTTSREVASPFTSKCLSSLKVNKLCSVE